jgi:hypothetical protein
VSLFRQTYQWNLKCLYLEVRTVDNGAEILETLDIILARHPGESDFVENFMPESGHNFRVHGQQVNNECKRDGRAISAR